ncbi:MAG: SDR family oxidoreductase [Acidobacteria bacterium]|nr:SDR family oxidoreductase [Acidobacteriota bacterium]
MELRGRAALVAGGARMGEALATRLAARGTAVALAYRSSREAAERAVGSVRAAGGSAVALRADLTNSADVAALTTAAVDHLGRLDFVVNLASIYRRTPFDALSDEALTDALEVDLVSAYRLARAAVPHLRAAGGGRIIHFADWTAASGRPRYRGYVPYYVAKRALIGLTEALALELAPDGILVNAVAPGPILPPPDLDASAAAAVERETPAGRWGGAGAVADVVIGLLESDFVTGETIRADGGRHLK